MASEKAAWALGAPGVVGVQLSRLSVKVRVPAVFLNAAWADRGKLAIVVAAE